MGLSISSQIVQLHGGRIEVVSEAGKGTEIVIWLPGAESGTAAADGGQAEDGPQE